MKRPFEIGDNLAYVLMYVAMILFFIILAITSEAQTVTLPTWVADSLIYEVKLSRQCTQVTAAQALEIESLNKELNATSKALALSQSSNETISALLGNARDYSGILTQQFTLDKNKLKAKIKRLWFWLISEGVVIGLLILL